MDHEAILLNQATALLAARCWLKRRDAVVCAPPIRRELEEFLRALIPEIVSQPAAGGGLPGNTNHLCGQDHADGLLAGGSTKAEVWVVDQAFTPDPATSYTRMFYRFPAGCSFDQATATASLIACTPIDPALVTDKSEPTPEPEPTPMQKVSRESIADSFMRMR